MSQVGRDDGAESMLPHRQYNIGYICTKWQCEQGRGGRIAMRMTAPDMSHCDYTFTDLEAQSNRVAHALGSLGLRGGDILFTLLPKMPEQFFVLLGALKKRLRGSPLFSNFGEGAILDRMGDARAKVVVTTTRFLNKISQIRSRLPSLRCIIVVDCEDHQSSTVLSYAALTRDKPDVYEVPLTGPDVPSIVHYTSGSTGRPKGVLHAHKAVVTIHRTTTEILGLSEDDTYWCTADQGWVTGTSYGMIGPWSCGVAQIHYGGGYHAETWLSVLREKGVTVWYTAPTALRLLMKEDASLFSKFDFKKLRHICSVGEPLNPEIIRWSRRILGVDIYDTWFMTETGAIMIANRAGLDMRPGSMGRPIEGVEAAILTDGGARVKDGECGNLCLKAGWPSMFIDYLNNKKAYTDKFKDGYYYSGDVAYADSEGYYWFAGRKDDVINTAGHLVGPFEVESALLEIDEIREAAVIAVPDAVLYEKIVAFVRVQQGCAVNKELMLKVRIHVADKVSTIAVPQDIMAVECIPKTKSGKIMRRVLKAQYLGQDMGDISTMEEF